MLQSVQSQSVLLNVSVQSRISIRFNITLLHKGCTEGKGETPVARFLRGQRAPSISGPRFLWLHVWGNFAP